MGSRSGQLALSVAVVHSSSRRTIRHRRSGASVPNLYESRIFADLRAVVRAGWRPAPRGQDDQSVTSRPIVFERNYALAGFDRRHTFTLASTYRLPFGSQTGNTLLDTLIRDWQVNGSVASYSGTPFTVTASNTALDQRGNLQTADLVGDVVRVGTGPDAPYYDPTAWANVIEQRYGTTGRNQFRGPGFWTLNMSLFRTFPLPGRANLQFRVEGFSLANQPQWSNPNGSVTSGSFMRINSTRGDATTGGGARYARFGLRLEF